MEPAQLPEPVQQPFRMAVVSLFPEMVETALQYGITGRALETGLWRLWTVNPREFATDNHRTVDDRPYGGGPGMVMMAGPVDQSLDCALEFIRADGFEGRPMVVYLSPQGERLTHRRVLQLKDERALVLLAGRYEGIDERLLERRVDLEISIGDYVVSGGEFPALVLIDALVRQLPGATNDPDSVNEDSFVEGLLDCPHYTRPEVHAGATVPPVLLSGNHAQIRRWRLKQSLGRTWMRRPDLLSQRALNGEEARLLDEFVNEDRKRKNGEKQDGSG